MCRQLAKNQFRWKKLKSILWKLNLHILFIGRRPSMSRIVEVVCYKADQRIKPIQCTQLQLQSVYHFPYFLIYTFYFSVAFSERLTKNKARGFFPKSLEVWVSSRCDWWDWNKVCAWVSISQPSVAVTQRWATLDFYIT